MVTGILSSLRTPIFWVPPNGMKAPLPILRLRSL